MRSSLLDLEKVMKPNFGPEDVGLMGRVCDEAWSVLSTVLVQPSVDYEQGTRRVMAERVIAAVEQGERDPTRLKAIALG
jgi:hypothetical protein